MTAVKIMVQVVGRDADGQDTVRLDPDIKVKCIARCMLVKNGDMFKACDQIGS